jgi:hypothetical protein
MKARKILTMILLLTTLLIAVGIIVMHSVEASNSSGEEGEHNNDHNLENKNDSKEYKLNNNSLLIGALIIIIIITLVGIYMQIGKVEPVSTETRVRPLFDPVYENYDHEGWCSSDSNWSKVNDSWESTGYEPGPEYGSVEQQYHSLYDPSEAKYR